MYTYPDVCFAVRTVTCMRSKGVLVRQRLHGDGRCVHAASLQQLLPAFCGTADLTELGCLE
jgi:hypothetical protein